MVESTPTKAIAGHDKSLSWQDWLTDSKQSADDLLRSLYGRTTARSIFFPMIDTLMLVIGDVMIAAGLLEPLLEPGLVRLRWQCVCIPTRVKMFTIP